MTRKKRLSSKIRQEIAAKIEKFCCFEPNKVGFKIKCVKIMYSGKFEETWLKILRNNVHQNTVKNKQKKTKLISVIMLKNYVF